MKKSKGSKGAKLGVEQEVYKLPETEVNLNNKSSFTKQSHRQKKKKLF